MTTTRNFAIRIGCALVAAAGIAGCASSGRPINEAAVAGFRAGATTEAQVIASLGSPQGSARLGNGTHMLTYTYARVAARPESFIPLVGFLVGGADSTTRTASFVFSPDGVLQDASSTQTEFGARSFAP